MVELEAGTNPQLVEFLTPVCKAFATETAVECANLAIQIHGGYGYCREYRVEQILRDARITCIYEGTNGIQTMTLAGRLLKMHGGECATAFERDIEAECRQAEQSSDFSKGAALKSALESWRVATQCVGQCDDPVFARTTTCSEPVSLLLPLRGVGWNVAQNNMPIRN